MKDQIKLSTQEIEILVEVFETLLKWESDLKLIKIQTIVDVENESSNSM